MRTENEVLNFLEHLLHQLLARQFMLKAAVNRTYLTIYI